MSILHTLQAGPRRKVPAYIQSEITECGNTCIAMIATYHGHAMTVSEMRAQFPPSIKGSSMITLMKVAQALNFSAKAVKLDLESLGKLTLPAIVHWDFSHYVVLVAVEHGEVTVNDPAQGEKRMPMEEFSKHFTGVALLLTPTEEFSLKRAAPTLTLRGLLGRISGAGEALGQVFFFALLLECAGLALPWFGRIVADEVLPNSDESLLTVLGAGFLVLVVVRAVLNYARNWTLTMVSTGIRAQIGEKVLRHALHLPPGFFERRRSTDVSSRFDSLAAIERTLVGSFISVLLDGMFSSVIVLLLFSYSSALGAILCVGVAVYAAVRWASYGPMHQLEMRIVEARAKQSGSLMETLRAIVPLQLADKALWRMAQWGVHLSEATNAELRLSRANAALSGSRYLVEGVVTVAFTWTAARLALHGELTLGALFAALAYQQLCFGRLITLVENLQSIRMLSVHLERLADIVGTPTQATDAHGMALPLPDAVAYTLRDVRFRYSPAEPELLKGVNLTVHAGEHVALTGPSGCGKTTLMKIMLGILEPTSGEVLLNGVPLREFGVQRQRALTAAVLQDDTLFFGSIRDNISYFDTQADDQRVLKAATLASLHQEVAAMPMGYMTLVGEGNGILSGGQRQRVLLARALYREPRLLMLDEATSALDLQNEARVNAGINTLSATRISIAHRPDTLVSAQRIVVLEAGQIAGELTPPEFMKTLQRGAEAQAQPVKREPAGSTA